MTERRLIPRIAILFILFGFTPLYLLAQNSAPPDSQSKRIAVLEQQAADAKTSADNAWMLTQLRAGPDDDRSWPGAFLWRAGAKEKCAGHDDAEFRHDGCDHGSLGDCGVQPCVWNRERLHRRISQSHFCAAWELQPDADYAATIPLQTFMVYQLMFAIITPALITGAFAERMKFSAMLLFTDSVVAIRLRPDGAHGVGQGRVAERVAGREVSDARFCRRHGGACHFGSFGAGLRAVSWASGSDIRKRRCRRIAWC